MADKVYPSTNPATATANGVSAPPAANSAAANPVFQPTKSQLYDTNRPAYRPQPPPRRRHKRGCCCSCCLWSTLLILLILIVAAIAGSVFYVIYRPHRPSFTVASLRLTKFNLTGRTINSAVNVTLNARNPNGKITFFYDQISVKLVSDSVEIGNGDFPAFTHGKKNTTVLRTVISSSDTQISEGTDFKALRSSFKNRKLPIRIQLDTNAKAKFWKITTPKVGIRVTCNGVSVSIPTANTTSLAAISRVNCHVELRIKIFKWTV